MSVFTFNNRHKMAAILVAMLFLIGCSSTKQFNQSSLDTTINENPQLFRSLSLAATGDRDRGVFNPLIGAATSLGYNAIEKVIRDERERTTLTHNDARSDLYFYEQLSDVHPLDPSGIRFDGLDIIRWKTDESGRRDTALYISFELDQSNPSELLNNSIFRMNVADIRVYDSEVPSGRRWYKPGTWFREKKNTLNISMEVVFLAHWIDDSMTMHTDVPMGRFLLSLEDFPLKGEPGYESAVERLVGTPVQGFSYLIPRSTGFTYDDRYQLVKKYGQGRFSVQITLKESKVKKPETTGIIKVSG
jgi:hypothetical protein